MTELSRRTVVHGAGATAFAASGIANLLPAPPLVDVETTLGPAALAAARAHCTKKVTSLPLPFDAHDRFVISRSFRAGLTRFLAGEDDVLIRRPDEAHSVLVLSYAHWLESSDYYVLTILRTILHERVREAFGYDQPRSCAACYGALRVEPGMPAVLLTARDDVSRRLYGDTLFADYYAFD